MNREASRLNNNKTLTYLNGHLQANGQRKRRKRREKQQRIRKNKNKNKNNDIEIHKQLPFNRVAARERRGME